MPLITYLYLLFPLTLAIFILQRMFFKTNPAKSLKTISRPRENASKNPKTNPNEPGKPELSHGERDAGRLVSMPGLDVARELENVERLFVEIARDFNPAIPCPKALVLRDR